MSSNGNNKDIKEDRQVNGAHGHHDIERAHQNTSGPLIRSPVRALVQDFSPICGIISILLHQHPYQFRGIHTLSVIGFVIDLVLYVIFTIILLSRFAVFRGQAYDEITNDLSQLFFMACWNIGYLTLPPLVALNVSQAYWGGYWAALLAYAMWWFGALFSFGMLFVTFSIVSRRHMAGGRSDDRAVHNTHTSPMPPLIILPAVAVATCAVTGALVVTYSHHMNARLAVPVIIMGFPLVGLAMALACFIYAMLWRQLLENGFPAPAQITSLFVWIGPFGQCAAALQALGSAAVAWFGTYNSGTFITAQAAQALDAACILGALLLMGPGAFFILFSIYGVIDTAISTRQVRWTPAWNAVIFPTATVTTATTYLAVEMDSPTFRVLASIQLVFLVVMYFVNATFTILGVVKGELLIVREDPRVKKEIEEQQKER